MISLLSKKQREEWMWCDECLKFHLKRARHLNRFEKSEAISFPVYTAPDYQSGILSCYYVSIDSIKNFFKYMKKQGENGHYVSRSVKR